MSSIDYSTVRHDLLFNTLDFGDREVTVFGVGGIGSFVAYQLAGLGIRNIRVYDPDIVEGVNPGNQCSGQADIGKPKVDALAEICKAKSGVEIKTHHAAANGSEPTGSVVFICVNGLPLRREIMNNIVRYNPHVELVIEARMGTTWGQVFCVDPRESWQVETWMGRTQGEGEDVGVTICGSKISVGVVTSTLANLCVGTFMHWRKTQSPLDPEEPKEIADIRQTPLPNTLTFTMYPPSLRRQVWTPPEDEFDIDGIELF